MEDKIKAWLESKVTPYRYGHSLRVLEAADRLARRYGLDGAPLRTAAMLHDCARGMTDGELLERAEDWDLGVRLEDRGSPVLLHGRVGAELARRELGIGDPVILGAIRAHTAGYPDMGLPDKVIFLADLIEPRRPFPHREQLEEAAFEDIDRAVLMGVEGNMRHCQRKGLAIDPDTLALHEALLKDR